jgi:hypothetical protein
LLAMRRIIRLAGFQMDFLKLLSLEYFMRLVK